MSKQECWNPELAGSQLQLVILDINRYTWEVFFTRDVWVDSFLLADLMEEIDKGHHIVT
jgi:hypothetical protein